MKNLFFLFLLPLSVWANDPIGCAPIEKKMCKSLDEKSPQSIAGRGFRRIFEVTTNQITTMANLLSPSEIFKPIFGFEGLYEISNFGRVKAPQKIVPRKNTYPVTLRERIIKLDKNSKGYYRVWLHNGEINVRPLVHRLVALHFIANPFPDRFDQINHKDGDHSNNHVDNLEWCDASWNHKHRFAVLGHTPGMLGKIQLKQRKPVIQMDMNGQFIKRYNRLMEVEKDGFKFRNVSACCLGTRTHYKNHTWKYE